MRKTIPITLGLTLVTCAAIAAPKPKAVKKPAAPTARPATRAVKGTAQMAGDNGKIGITYTLGKGEDALNFTLNRAEYSVICLPLDSGPQELKGDEKWMILHYSVQNPNKSEQTYNWASFQFTAVDSDNINRESLGSVMKEGTNVRYDERLKPAQKVDFWTAIKLPVKATAPKIIVQRGDAQPVLRLYFAKNELKVTPALYADPSDPTGAAARTEVPAEMGVYYPMGYFDVKLEGISYGDKAGELEPEENKQYCFLQITFKNTNQEPITLNWATMACSIKTDDDEKTSLTTGVLLKGKRDEKHDESLAATEEYTGRLAIEIAKGTKAVALTLRLGEEGRLFTFKLK